MGFARLIRTGSAADDHFGCDQRRQSRPAQGARDKAKDAVEPPQCSSLERSQGRNQDTDREPYDGV